MAILTRDEVKTLLQIPTADTSKDTLIDSLITKVQDFIIRRINNFADPNVHIVGYDVTFDKANKTITLEDTLIEYGFITAGFIKTNLVWVEGSYQNNGLYTIADLTESVLTTTEALISDEVNINMITFKKIVFNEEVKIAAADFIAMKINKNKYAKSISSGDYSETAFKPSEMMDAFSMFKKIQWN